MGFMVLIRFRMRQKRQEKEKEERGKGGKTSQPFVFMLATFEVVFEQQKTIRTRQSRKHDSSEAILKKSGNILLALYRVPTWIFDNGPAQV